MEVNSFIDVLRKELLVEFFVGVPDSQLKPLCDTLFTRYGLNKEYVIAANEGGAVGLAAGHYLAKGRPALVYMQNSGLGNVINPVASLLHEKVYKIPAVFVVGWRGEPNVHDEPQHIFQGEITLETLELLGIEYLVIDKDTKEESFLNFVLSFKDVIKEGKSIAFVIKKDGLSKGEKPEFGCRHTLVREDVISEIAKISEDEIIVSTTGKTSRELFEIREKLGQGHEKDFLTVGSMGHSSMIALGMAKADDNHRVWCIDGDGATIMHLGSFPVIAKSGCDNMVHILINNGAHESVGGMPVIDGSVNFCEIAKAVGYPLCYRASTLEEVRNCLSEAKLSNKLCFVEIMTKTGSRKDLGRPTKSPQENKIALMDYVKSRRLQNEGANT